MQGLGAATSVGWGVVVLSVGGWIDRGVPLFFFKKIMNLLLSLNKPFPKIITTQVIYHNLF